MVQRQEVPIRTFRVRSGPSGKRVVQILFPLRENEEASRKKRLAKRLHSHLQIVGIFLNSRRTGTKPVGIRKVVRFRRYPCSIRWSLVSTFLRDFPTWVLTCWLPNSTPRNLTLIGNPEIKLMKIQNNAQVFKKLTLLNSNQLMTPR